jgi:hypothetical protein
MYDELADHPILRTVAQTEAIQAAARLRDTHLVVTERRLAVASDARLMLDVPIHNLRRIQFDIERTRPATLVIVPEHPDHEPQVLAVPRHEYRAVADVLVVIGERLADSGPAPQL